MPVPLLLAERDTLTDAVGLLEVAFDTVALEVAEGQEDTDGEVESDTVPRAVRLADTLPVPHRDCEGEPLPLRVPAREPLTEGLFERLPVPIAQRDAEGDADWLPARLLLPQAVPVMDAEREALEQSVAEVDAELARDTVGEPEEDAEANKESVGGAALALSPREREE